MGQSSWKAFRKHAPPDPGISPPQRPFRCVLANGAAKEAETRFQVLWHYGRVFLRAPGGRYLGTLPVGLLVARATHPGKKDLRLQASCSCGPSWPWRGGKNLAWEGFPPAQRPPNSLPAPLPCTRLPQPCGAPSPTLPNLLLAQPPQQIPPLLPLAPLGPPHMLCPPPRFSSDRLWGAGRVPPGLTAVGLS